MSTQTFSDREDRSDSEDEDSLAKPTSLQQKMVALSGQNIDEFMKEMESVQKKKEGDKDDIRSVETLLPPGTDPVAAMPMLAPPHHSHPPPGLMFPGGPLRFVFTIVSNTFML